MKLLRRILYFFAFHLYAKRKMSRHDEADLLGFKLRVAPTVFHPTLFFTSQFLGEYVSSCNLGTKTVLDMGTGSGIIGLCAARAGANVLSVDINPTAVECAKSNAARNGYTENIRCIECDLFSAIPASERFDYIIWNPPFYRASPKDDAERAWNAGVDLEALREFAINSRKYLNDKGTVVLVLSTDMDIKRVLGFFSAAGFQYAAVSQRRMFFESLTIFLFTVTSP